MIVKVSLAASLGGKAVSAMLLTSIVMLWSTLLPAHTSPLATVM